MSSGTKRPVYKGNRNGMILISIVVVILFAALAFQCARLLKKNSAYAQQIESLEQAITEENGRTERIEEFRSYTSTDAYVEKAAREKFGLVYPDEILFKPGE